ncbi:hypothetical protein AAFF_G00397020 [Aldrovandia affinis]|uniref:Uncharacterized protein n=1 Tax=Aldrovandia affinis TaxID=143900 RepID=A0AAD7WLC8_9TELE|nr:hypothetical protein AAFF_G00397020 [Aldrovandia affinis]
MIAAVTTGAAGAVALVPVALGAVGFKAGGIVAGSTAAYMMSTAAIINGDGVAAGSLMAVLQSTGDTLVTSSPCAKNLGVVMDNRLSLSMNIAARPLGCRRDDRHCRAGICSGLGCPEKIEQDMMGSEWKQLKW